MESRLLMSKLYLAPEHLYPPPPSSSSHDVRQKVKVIQPEPRHRKKLRILFVPAITDLKSLHHGQLPCVGLWPLHRMVSCRFS